MYEILRGMLPTSSGKQVFSCLPSFKIEWKHNIILFTFINVF